jgi:hypothetical protein
MGLLCRAGDYLSNLDCAALRAMTAAYAGSTQKQGQKPNAENKRHFVRNLCGDNFVMRRINTNLDA